MRPILLLMFPWSVGRSVGHVTNRYPAKTAGPIEMPFGMWGGPGGVGSSNHVGVRTFPGEGAISGDFFSPLNSVADGA